MKTLKELSEEGQDAYNTMIVAIECGHTTLAEQANQQWLSILDEIKEQKYVKCWYCRSFDVRVCEGLPIGTYSCDECRGIFSNVEVV